MADTAPTTIADLLEHLVDDGALELAPRAQLPVLAGEVERALDLGGDAAEKASRVHALLLDSPLVDELFLDEEQLGKALAKVR